MKEEDETLSKLVNHAKVTADGTAAGIVAQTKEKVLLEDCVNTGVIEQQESQQQNAKIWC